MLFELLKLVDFGLRQGVVEAKGDELELEVLVEVRHLAGEGVVLLLKAVVEGRGFVWERRRLAVG